MHLNIREALAGCLLGTAVGDSLGLPYENLSRRRAARLLPGPLRHRFLLGRGMISDDTEHALFVAQALLAHPDSTERFARSLAWKLRWWFLGLPAGVGLATIRACIKLWLGFPPGKSGVRSAGNGPAMRAALIGVYFQDAEKAFHDYVRAATLITHRDPRAVTGAMAIALCARAGVLAGSANWGDGSGLIGQLRHVAEADAEWQKSLDAVDAGLAANRTVLDFADSLGLETGVSGYIYHTVPVAIYAWLRHRGDFRATLEAVVQCGGDTDTVGAIAGALAGSSVGAEAIPQEWIEGISDWPRSTGLLREVADRLAAQRKEGKALGPVDYPWPGVIPRNLFFLAVVLAHGVRRLLLPC